jgi:hypothetical protein
MEVHHLSKASHAKNKCVKQQEKRIAKLLTEKHFVLLMNET